MKLLLIFVFTFLLTTTFLISSIFAADQEVALGPQGILAISKIAGACGILDSMSHFQKTTKMQGGDEFIARFWSMEASRLGYSPEEYIENCKKAISSYDKLWNSTDTQQK